ncbi:MAG: MmcQ/YjbR family DNA-binding protein [Actinomycetota bacterium]|nr:MmcQ/YjbR family DNA-binding protein [Actinomycetota bacterium]
MASWDDVRRIALALPETDERVVHGNASWRVRDKGFVWERPLRRGDLEALGPGAPTGPILGVRVEHLIAKDAMIADNPEVFFTTPHFDGYTAVLVLVDKIAVDELEEVIVEAWLARAPKRVAKEYIETRLPPGG